MLEQLLRDEIQKRGPLSQNDFIGLALQHPLYGYYRSQESVGQDFTTAPEISQVFGEVIAAWAIDYYEKLKQPQSLSLVELGPGKGSLIADFLRASKISKSFYKALSVFLVEINPLLKEAQLKKIGHSAIWVERVEDIPCFQTPLIIIANEFFDVLPAKCYTRKDNILYEKCVEVKDRSFAFTLVPIGENQGPDQVWEENPEAERIMSEICTRLLKQKGVFLFIDYGYERGTGESLQALFKGEPSNPLSNLGKSDLTCHVNFGRLKEIALSQGLGVAGPISQNRFLKNIGFDVRVELLKDKNPFQRAKLEMAATRLTHPQQMGDLFKVAAVFSPSSLSPAGFA